MCSGYQIDICSILFLQFQEYFCQSLLSDLKSTVTNGNFPVLAKTADGVVIIAGYDQYNTILLKPGEAETYYYGLEESADMFEAAGNQFVTYFDPLEE